MSDLIERVTVLQRDADVAQAVTLYRRDQKRSAKSSTVSRSLEKATRRMIRAEIIFAEDLLRRHDESSRRRKDGWLLEAPANMVGAGRKAYNEARKAVPFRLLPKA